MRTALALLTAILIAASATAATPDFDPQYPSYADPSEANGRAAEIGKCRIHVIGAYFWRDWMPVVSHPGPDGGSRLYAKVRLGLGNQKAAPCRLSFQGTVVDVNGQTHPIDFRVLPNYRVLPEEIDKRYRDLGAEARQAVLAEYNVVWDGSLKAGETRTVELLASEGPYLPVGSRLHVELTWRDQDGKSAAVRTLDERVRRTD